jgi:hypothetical protein
MLNSPKIKEFISNPDVYLAHTAVGYFDDSLSQDEEILNLVLDRCDTLNETEQVLLLSEAQHLKVNSEALHKIIKALPTASSKLKILYEKLLVNADTVLLNSSGLNLQQLNAETKIIVNQKLNISNHSTTELLEELLNFSLDNDTKYMDEFDYNYGILIASELSNRSDLDEKKIIEALSSINPEEYGYYECYLINLAGKRKLHTLIPVFINGLGLGDLVSEDSMAALINIGTSDIISLIADRYLKASDDFKIYASGVLENIKLKESEATALNLLKKEKDLTLKTLLAGALCRLFSTEAMPEIKALIADEYDSSMLSLEEFAYVNCVFNGINIPEMSSWKEAYEEEKDFYLNPPQFDLPVVSEAKIGRNDPCPCGSGKKYKKCCGKN